LLFHLKTTISSHKEDNGTRRKRRKIRKRRKRRKRRKKRKRRKRVVNTFRIEKGRVEESRVAYNIAFYIMK
jgi:hypothetical protein